jgi:hypothetical protein
MFRIPLTRFLLHYDFNGVPLFVIQHLLDGSNGGGSDSTLALAKPPPDHSHKREEDSVKCKADHEGVGEPTLEWLTANRRSIG